MSKNFEDAYKAEVQQNIPDLWSRIESSLPEKTPVAAAETMAPEAKAESVASTQNRQNTNSNKKTKKNPYAWIKWASLAAAGLLLVVLMPAVLGIGIFSLIAGSKTSSDMAANESCAEEPQYAADAEENMMYDSDSMEGGFTMDSVTEEFIQEEMAEEVANPESGVQSTPESEGKESAAFRQYRQQKSEILKTMAEDHLISTPIKPIDDDIEVTELPEHYTRKDLERLKAQKDKMAEDAAAWAEEHKEDEKYKFFTEIKEEEAAKAEARRKKLESYKRASQKRNKKGGK